MAARQLPKKRLVKYVNIKIGHRFLVHICICNYSTLFNVFIELTNMSTVTIVTVGITHCI